MNLIFWIVSLQVRPGTQKLRPGTQKLRPGITTEPRDKSCSLLLLSSIVDAHPFQLSSLKVVMLGCFVFIIF